VRIERESEGEFRRWSIEWDDWTLRLIAVVLVALLAPGTASLIVHSLAGASH
jgi:hypothetical protein